MPFIDSLDVANRALQYCGGNQILSTTEDTPNNLETAFAYDKLRRVELRRNVWRFAIRNCVLRPVGDNTMQLQPAAYDATEIYLPGSIVSDANGQLWLSMTEGNQNNTPGGNNEVWDAYFGSLTIEPYDSTQTYYSGELVYMAGTNPGSYSIFMSLHNANADVPNVATAWDATVTYHGEDIVSYSGSQWRNLIEINLNITPADGPLPYDAGTTYAIGDTVTASDHFIYSSVGNGNIGNDPTTDSGVHWTNTALANAWERTPAVGISSTKWRIINATMKQLTFTYPIGSGPLSQSTTRNVFRLPAGFLRRAPQDQTAGGNSYLGAAANIPYKDWQLQGNYIVSGQVDPIMFRFVADVTVVSKMDDMFCEGLACRIASGIAERLTQSEAKLQTIASAYKLFMGEARLVNGIETGAEYPPLDDYIQCRQ